MTYLFAILALGLLIALHEFGHLIVARLVGMRVDRYSLGFGPVLVRFQRGETEYCLSAVPLGGYVKIAGMAPGEEIDPKDPRAFGKRPSWQRLAVVAAGPITNWLLAVALVYAVALAGMPDTRAARVGQILPGSAADAAGLEAGDLVQSLDGAPLGTFQDLVSAVQSHPGQTVALELVRAGQPLRLDVRLATPAVLGVAAPLRHYDPLAAVPAAVGWTGRQTVGMVISLGDALRHPRGAQLSGPIGTVQVTVEEARHGWQNLVFTLAVISLALAVFNVLPWPALDGGRLIFLLFEAIFRRPVNQRVETAVHALGFLLLLALILAVTVGDLKRLIGPRSGAPATTGKP